MACTQVDMNHSDKREDKIQYTVTNGGQDRDNRYEAHEAKVMHNRPNSRSGEMGKRSGYISHKPERLGIVKIVYYMSLTPMAGAASRTTLGVNVSKQAKITEVGK